MQYLWEIESGFLKDILELFSRAETSYQYRFHYFKILMEKEFVGHKVHGRQHEYFPLISKETYSGKSIKSLVKTILKVRIEMRFLF